MVRIDSNFDDRNMKDKGFLNFRPSGPFLRTLHGKREENNALSAFWENSFLVAGGTAIFSALKISASKVKTFLAIILNKPKWNFGFKEDFNI